VAEHLACESSQRPIGARPDERVDKLKDEAEKEAREHPQQISEGEQAIEKKLGMNSDADETSQHDQNTPPRDAGPEQQGN
jgi:hypothetical protein